MDEQNINKTSLAHTAGAVILFIVLFTLVSIVVAPIVSSITGLFGEHILPNRMGGGSNYNNPGFFETLRRACIIAGICGFISYMGTSKVFPKAITKQYISVSTILIALSLLAIMLFGKKHEESQRILPVPAVEAPAPSAEVPKSVVLVPEGYVLEKTSTR